MKVIELPQRLGNALLLNWLIRTHGIQLNMIGKVMLYRK